LLIAWSQFLNHRWTRNTKDYRRIGHPLVSDPSQKLVEKVYDHPYRHAGENWYLQVFEIPERRASLISDVAGLSESLILFYFAK
jgi:hypothetical protein